MLNWRLLLQCAQKRDAFWCPLSCLQTCNCDYFVATPYSASQLTRLLLEGKKHTLCSHQLLVTTKLDTGPTELLVIDQDKFNP